MSYKEGDHPIFPYTEEDKMEIRSALRLKHSTIQNDIDTMMEWFQKQPHLIAAGLPDRDYLERMLVNAKGSVEKAKRRIDNFYKYRSLAPELIQNRNIHLDSDSDIWSFYRQAVIPELYELKRVSVLEFTDPDANNFEIDVLLKNAILLGDIRLRYDYMLGDIWVLDLKQTGLGHLLRINPLIFSKASHIFLDGFGIRLHSIHVLGAPTYAQQLLQFFGKFAKQKIMERIMFHNSLEELYKHVPKKYLPKEYGGDQPSLDYFKEKYLSILRTDDTKQFLAECSKQISDESQRPEDFIDEEYLNGSFKQLDLD